MLHSTQLASKLALIKRSRRAVLKKFGRDEDGSIIVMTLVLLVTMLVLGGMAVDFMRFESRRALLQSVADRSVLAAASLDQTLPGEEVIIDFYDKAGFGGTIVGTPFVEKVAGSGNSEVRVDSRIDVNTFYLRLIGIDSLSAPATAQAQQGTGNVEISLVLDISGSMGNNVTVDEPVLGADGEPMLNGDGDVITTSVTRTKMYLLQKAASQFVDDLLIEDFRNQISINLIAYSQQVALDDDLYKALRTTPDSMNVDGKLGSTFGVISDGYATTTDDSYTAPVDGAPIDVSWADGLDVHVNPSRCIDFDAADFNTVAFDVGQRYEQVEYFEHYSSGDSGIDFPVCPEEEFESILLLSQDATELKRRINAYRPTSFTSIHLGVKWGISLLDPALRPILANITSIDETFRDNRPANFGGDTVKIMVVMTDGVNVASRRLRDTAYDEYEERVRWSEYPFDYWRNNVTSPRPNRGVHTNNPGSFTLFNTWMNTLCTAAKTQTHPVTIYTIAMGAGDGAAEIAKCATQPSYAFSTNVNNTPGEPGIGEIFATIADRITALRLAL